MNQGRRREQERFSEMMVSVAVIGGGLLIVGLMVYNIIKHGV